MSRGFPRKDELPPRASRAKGHERVPEPGHDAAKRVPDEEWARNNERRSTAQGLADDEPETE